MTNALVSDFDGTITRNDFFALVAERYKPAGFPDYLEQYRAGLCTHFDAMAAYFAHTPTDPGILDELLRDTEPDPEFANTAEKLRAAGWELIIVSAGSSWYIDRILAMIGVQAVVHANPGRIGRGLEIEKPFGSPFFSDNVGVDKPAVVRDALSHCERVAFAGDGPPDVSAALLVEPGLRFAHGYLAGELARRGERFTPFERWSEIAAALL